MLFEQIEREHEETCIYKRLVLDYKVGLGKIYSQAEIDKAQRSPSFEKEYCCRYLGHQGNTFRPEDIERCKSIKYDPDKINKYASISIGIDSGWGSSAFGICVLQLENEIIETLYASEFEKADYNEMLDKVHELYLKFSPAKIYIDGSASAFIRSLKEMIGESEDYEKVIEIAKHEKIDPNERMVVIPVNFQQKHKQMLGNLRMLIEQGAVAIHPTRFDKLLIALSTACDVEGKLDKCATSHDDILDALRLAAMLFETTNYTQQDIDLSTLIHPLTDDQIGRSTRNLRRL